MGLSLGNLLKQATAQVNTFDHGKTAATVRATQKPAPAQLPKQNRPQPNLFNRLGNTIHNDVVAPIQRDVVKPATPVVNFATGLANTAYHVGAIPVNTARTAVAEATHNLPAQRSATNQTRQGFSALRQLGQGTAGTAYGLGESVNPFGGDVFQRTHTPTSPIEKFALGNQPIPSIQHQYQTTRANQGTGAAIVEAGLTGLMDAGGLKGVAKTAKLPEASRAVVKQAPVVAKATSKAVNPHKFALDQHYQQLQKSYDVAKTQTQKNTLNKLMAQNRADYGAVSEGGFVRIPGGNPRQNLSKALGKGSSKPISFGRLSNKKLTEINAQRVKSNLPPIKNKEVLVHPNVVKKLQDKRIKLDGLTADQVADIAYSAVHNTKSRVLPGKYGNQTLVKPGENTSSVAHLGEHKGAGSLKTAYPLKTNRLSKLSDGPASSSSPLTGTSPKGGGAGISAVESISNVPEIGAKVNPVNKPNVPEGFAKMKEPDQLNAVIDGRKPMSNILPISEPANQAARLRAENAGLPSIRTNDGADLYYRPENEAAARRAAELINSPKPKDMVAYHTELGKLFGYTSKEIKEFVDKTTAKVTQPTQAATSVVSGETQPKQAPSQPVSAPKAKSPPKLPQKAEPPQPVASSLPNSTKDYVKQQVEAQKQAAKSDIGKGAKIRQELKTKLIDSLAPIEDPVIKQVGRKGELNLRNQLDRSLRSPTIAGQFAEQHGLHGIIKNVPNVDEFNQLLIAKHAQDLEANGVKTGRNLSADKQLINDLGAKYASHSQALTNYNHKLLDQTVKYGLIPKETAAHLKAKYPNYVPFDRIFKDGELTGGGNGSGPASLSTQTVVQRIKGSERQVQPPIESILAKTHDVIAQGERNLAAQEIAKFKDLPGNPLSLKELKPNETIGTRSTISYLENGQKHTFETTPEIAAAAKSLNKQQLGILGKILSYPTRVLRLGATGANAAFAMANVTKDVASAFINSEHPLRASVGNPHVFLNALKAAGYHKSGSYAELVSQGAGGTSFDIARNAAKDTVKQVRADRNVGTKALYTVKHPGELLRAVEDTIGRSEEFGRAVQYFGNKQAALAKGKSISEAQAYGADAARNNTINFARAGEYGRVLNSVLPYLNAGVQGSRTLLRNVKDRPVATGTKIAVTAFMPVAVTTAWNLNSPERRAAYNDISEYEKQNNIIIVPPNPHKDPKTGRWNVIKIPVSQEVANLNNTVRNGVEAMAKDKGFNFAGMAGDLAGTATSLNAGKPRQLIGQITPQAIKPSVEALTNQNLFTGNKIVPDSQRNLSPQDQYGPYTSGTAKQLGKHIGVSPLMIDNTIRTATGGLGQNVVNLSDKALAKAGVIPQSDVKGQSLSTSISGRFNSAQAISSGTTVDNAVKQATDKLKQTAGYKNLPNTEKAKALNRLETDVKAVQYRQIDAKNQTGQYSPSYTGKQTKLTPRQAGLVTGSTDLSKYLTPQTSGGSSVVVSPKLDKQSQSILNKYPDTTARTKAFNTQNDAEYKYNLAKYNNDKLNGSLTRTQDIKTQASLNKEKVGSSFSKDTRDLYGLSKAEIYSLVSTDPNGKDILNNLLSYDNALTKAGVQAKNKLTDKYGKLNISPKSKTSTAKSKYSTTSFANSLSSSNKSLLQMLNKAKVSSGTKYKAGKKVTLRKYSPVAGKAVKVA